MSTFCNIKVTVVDQTWQDQELTHPNAKVTTK